MLKLQNGIASVAILSELINQKLPYHQSELIIRVAASTSEGPHTKTVGDEATTSGNGKKWCHQYNDYSAKERADIGK